jgi:GntR family transcriptional regulator, rspAB operon transcriptional repressor
MGRRLARIAKTELSKAELSKTELLKTELLAERAQSSPTGRSISFRRNTIGAQIHGVLRRDIITGRLAPRAMLSEQDIAAGFGISRTPVREAMIKLAEEGLVEIFPQYGSFVAPIKLRDVFDSQFAREALECAAVEKAVDRLDALQDRQLKAVINRQRATQRPQEREAFFRADEDMHMLILKIAGHGAAWHFVESAKVQMDRVRHLAITIARKQALILAEHEAVVDRLLARDRDGAVAAMRAHLRGIFRTIEMLRNDKNDYFADEDGGASAGNQRSAMPSRQPRKYVKSKTQPGK